MSDHVSARVITDASGNVLEQKGHFPYGEVWYEGGTNSSKWKFTTYERDTESGNDHAIFRVYVSGFGRFNRPDPIAGSVANPQSLNRYGYVQNDPINLVDPLGRFEATAQLQPLHTTVYVTAEGATFDLAAVPGAIDIAHMNLAHWITLWNTWDDMREPRGPVPGSGSDITKLTGPSPLNTPPPPPSDCQMFADSLASRQGSAGDLHALGSQMMAEAMADTPSSGGSWKRLPIGGFRQEFVNNGQRGDVYRHILFFAGATLNPSWFNSLMNFLAFSWDTVQSTYRRESEAELRGNNAGMSVGAAMRDVADYGALYRIIASILCHP